MNTSVFIIAIFIINSTFTYQAQAAQNEKKTDDTFLCQSETLNKKHYVLSFNDSANDAQDVNVFRVISNAPWVSFSIYNLKIKGLTTIDGSMPRIRFENAQGKAINLGETKRIKANGTGKYDFGFKIKTNKNKNFYLVNKNKKGVEVTAAISFSCG